MFSTGRPNLIKMFNGNEGKSILLYVIACKSCNKYTQKVFFIMHVFNNKICNNSIKHCAKDVIFVSK